MAETMPKPEVSIGDFLLKQNNFFSWKTSFRSLLWASSGLRENVLLARSHQMPYSNKTFLEGHNLPLQLMPDHMQ